MIPLSAAYSNASSGDIYFVDLMKNRLVVSKVFCLI